MTPRLAPSQRSDSSPPVKRGKLKSFTKTDVELGQTSPGSGWSPVVTKDTPLAPAPVVRPRRSSLKPSGGAAAAEAARLQAAEEALSASLSQLERRVAALHEEQLRQTPSAPDLALVPARERPAAPPLRPPGSQASLLEQYEHSIAEEGGAVPGEGDLPGSPEPEGEEEAEELDPSGVIPYERYQRMPEEVFGTGRILRESLTVPALGTPSAARAPTPGLEGRSEALRRRTSFPKSHFEAVANESLLAEAPARRTVYGQHPLGSVYARMGVEARVRANRANALRPARSEKALAHARSVAGLGPPPSGAVVPDSVAGRPRTAGPGTRAPPTETWGHVYSKLFYGDARGARPATAPAGEEGAPGGLDASPERPRTASLGASASPAPQPRPASGSGSGSPSRMAAPPPPAVAVTLQSWLFKEKESVERRAAAHMASAMHGQLAQMDRLVRRHAGQRPPSAPAQALALEPPRPASAASASTAPAPRAASSPPRHPPRPQRAASAASTRGAGGGPGRPSTAPAGPAALRGTRLGAGAPPPEEEDPYADYDTRRPWSAYPNIPLPEARPQSAAAGARAASPPALRYRVLARPPSGAGARPSELHNPNAALALQASDPRLAALAIGNARTITRAASAGALRPGSSKAGPGKGPGAGEARIRGPRWNFAYVPYLLQDGAALLELSGLLPPRGPAEAAPRPATAPAPLPPAGPDPGLAYKPDL